MEVVLGERNKGMNGINDSLTPHKSESFQIREQGFVDGAKLDDRETSGGGLGSHLV
jgi:hypothetical protein